MKLVENASGRDSHRYKRTVGVTRDYPFVFTADRLTLSTPFKRKREGNSRITVRMRGPTNLYFNLPDPRQRERKEEGGRGGDNYIDTFNLRTARRVIFVARKEKSKPYIYIYLSLDASQMRLGSCRMQRCPMDHAMDDSTISSLLMARHSLWENSANESSRFHRIRLWSRCDAGYF